MAKTIIKSSAKFTRRHAINLNTAFSLQDAAGARLESIQAAAIMDDIDRETGETKPVAAIVTGDGATYTSISAVVMESMEDIIELLDDGETFDLQVVSRKTKSSNRDYLSLVVI